METRLTAEETAAEVWRPDRLLEFLSGLYGLVPRPFRRALLPCSEKGFAFVRRIGRRIADGRLPVFFLEGHNPSSGEKLTSLVFGRERIVSFLGRMMFGRKFKRAFWGWSRPAEIGLRLHDRTLPAADLVFIHADQEILRRRFGDSCLILPEWVTFRLDLRPPGLTTTWTHPRNKNFRENLRRVRKYGYAYEISLDPSAFESFYNEMYLPLARERHGESAELVGRRMMRLFFEGGSLLQVKDGGDPVGGNILVRKRGGFKSVVIGVKGGRADLLRKGVMAASYHFTVQWARSQGAGWVDFGECRPFLNDGLVYFKKRWGMGVERYPFLSRGIALRVKPDSPAVRRFLGAHPAIYLSGGGLAGMVVADEGRALTAARVRALVQKYDIPGLKRLIVSCHEGFRSEAEAWAARSEARLVLTRQAPEAYCL